MALKRGRVLFLDPEILDGQDAKANCGQGERIKNPHFFVCLGPCEPHGFLWMPMSSSELDDGTARAKVESHQKKGIGGFQDGNSFILTWQVWWFTEAAAAAAAHKDDALKERPRIVNIITGEAVPAMPDWRPPA